MNTIILIVANAYISTGVSRSSNRRAVVESSASGLIDGTRQQLRTAGVARYPRWSPDGRRFACWTRTDAEERLIAQTRGDVTPHVAARVYDVRGKLVREVANGNLPAGMHQIVWDGTTTTGLPASRGHYFFEVRFDSHRQVRRVTLLR